MAILLVAVLVSGCAAPAATPAAEATGVVLPSPAASPPSTVLPAPVVPPGRVRPATVAGSWYPDDPQELAATIDELLAAVEPVDGVPLGLIVPHAGYAYSGPVAAVGFRQLQGAPVDVAIVVAPDHQPPLSNPVSVWAEGGFETPLGIVPVDVELAQALIEADPRITFDPAAHAGEHAIEIELPFLQRACPTCRVVPVLMGNDDEATVQMLADALVKVLQGRQSASASAVVIASSDLSHYPSYDNARAVDGATLAAVETGVPARVRETIGALMGAGVPNLATCACGEGPILVAMRVAQGLGADTVSVLYYANSGDSSQGDQSQVVGYGAVMLWRYEPPDLTPAQREELLALARTAIAEYLKTGEIPEYETGDPILNRRSGTFVTLRENSELRGCIGHTRGDQPLYQVVQQMAVAAATEDPRFPPLKPEELDQVTLEISVLSPFRRVTDTGQIQVGTHGLMIFADGHQGLLLPQVPVEQGWDREEFLENLCLKAGLAPDCQARQPALYAFTAVVFGEEGP
ncbi:MAG TPA: AmmeMemoRadiSam system protein B [Anaerolineae bacterium]|nr:AmmeMemoRadiSam system protein B [Anaerolineae bacterium]